MNAAISAAVDQIRNTAPYNVNGAGWTVGVWDAGAARVSHQEYGGRVTILDGAPLHYHAAHVTGTICASGVNAAALGMAPSVSVDGYNWTNDESRDVTSGPGSALRDRIGLAPCPGTSPGDSVITIRPRGTGT